jgi:hypothetical protein
MHVGVLPGLVVLCAETFATDDRDVPGDDRFVFEIIFPFAKARYEPGK